MSKKHLLVIAIIFCFGAALVAQYYGTGESPDAVGSYQRFNAAGFTGAARYATREALSRFRDSTTITRPGSSPRVAITEIDGPDYDFQWRDWARSEIEDTITKEGSKFQLFERNRLDLVVAEMGFQRGGQLSDRELQNLGARAGAEYIIHPSINTTPGGPVLRIKIMSVNDGRTFTASSGPRY